MRKYMTIEDYFKTQQGDKVKSNRPKLLRKVLLILCLVIIIFSLYTILNWLYDNYKIRQINKEIDKSININSNNAEGELVNPPSDGESNYYYYAKFPFYQVSFSILLEQNKDTVGFIKVKNTNINYPVVQSIDNDYYLNHSFDKDENDAGWVFMDYRNNINDLDDNTVIYGHARLDGTMFGTLKNLLSSSWQENRENYVIFLSTPKENMVFQIFSIYTIKSESYYITQNFSNKNKKQIWIDTMKKRNVSPINTEVNVNDKFLTLSTCQNNQGGRVVVHAKLIKRQRR